MIEKEREGERERIDVRKIVYGTSTNETSLKFPMGRKVLVTLYDNVLIGAFDFD